jgi:hypothetical protein
VGGAFGELNAHVGWHGVEEHTKADEEMTISIVSCVSQKMHAVQRT